MSLSEPYDDRLMADLAAAADGTLPPSRQAELEAMAEADPELAAALDEQRRAVTLIQGAAAEIRAPLALRERLENERARAAKPAPRRRWFSIALAGAAAAAVFLAVLLAAPGGPTVEDAAAFAVPAAPPAPPPPRRARCSTSTRSGVAFPAWAEKFGWEATGTNTGEIDGREATTVYYENADGKTLAYTIVSGDALDTPGRHDDDRRSRARRSRSSARTARPPPRGSATGAPASCSARASRTRSSPSSPAGAPRARSPSSGRSGERGRDRACGRGRAGS